MWSIIDHDSVPYEVFVLTSISRSEGVAYGQYLHTILCLTASWFFHQFIVGRVWLVVIVVIRVWLVVIVVLGCGLWL